MMARTASFPDGVKRQLCRSLRALTQFFVRDLLKRGVGFTNACGDCDVCIFINVRLIASRKVLIFNQENSSY
jgi:hypothetical protein